MVWPARRMWAGGGYGLWVWRAGGGGGGGCGGLLGGGEIGGGGGWRLRVGGDAHSIPAARQDVRGARGIRGSEVCDVPSPARCAQPERDVECAGEWDREHGGDGPCAV